jgi:predicted nuclease of restriction endonuclease-like (RecB) superfamily
MIEAYWQIGRRIVEQEQQGETRAAYGEQVLKELSKALTAEFGKGFSSSNLRNFRQFYLTYPNEQICYTVCSKLTWSHNRLIMRVDDPKARSWYLKEAAEQGWSVRILDRNIDTLYYQRLLSSQRQETSKDGLLLEKASPTDFIKDPYVFEFLNIPEPINSTEREIENALIENLQQFLLELGKGFSL